MDAAGRLETLIRTAAWNSGTIRPLRRHTKASGPPVIVGRARRPGPVVLEGRFGQVEKLDAARYRKTLWEAFKDDDAIWTYMGAESRSQAATENEMLWPSLKPRRLLRWTSATNST